ncbi:benzoate/H(+) symporter BenE family transporter [uncultured Aquabacterium sp.]|jgi:benzoate membrane transport protein|uniref:benzoate/H(+) symporter BenE family transporter n=1 Tax=uncultured Aquabacterium sp. TaxID=158753 RepID=UPI0026180973|nr:benzoate/H(+) symporter BenE family transporter [uncultured Aquabacterium sp.]
MLRQDWSFSALAAGFLAVLVSYAGPLLILFQAAQVGMVPPDIVASWVWAISIGAAVSGIALSWWFKAPVITAWSAPGTALLVTLFPAMPLDEVVGAYLVAAVLIGLIGITGMFDRLMRLIPRGVAYGMMAGILFQFGLRAFKSMEALPLLTAAMVVGYLLFKRRWPRYHMVLVLALGLVLTVLQPHAPWPALDLRPTLPVFTAPAWSWSATFSLAIPLVLVSLSGQFMPGMAILHAAGYRLEARPIIAATSAVSVFTAFFGGITTVLAAITAALCTGRDAHEDPRRRYVAGLANGLFYLIGGTFGGLIVWLFAVLPGPFVAVLAGLALTGAITSNVLGAVTDEPHREAAILTFLATASGVSFLGLGSAFWGVALGSLTCLVNHPRTRQTPG